MIAVPVPLADVVPPAPGQEPKPGFEAMWQGQPVIVTAVLERTAVVELQDGEKHVARKADVLVDEAALFWVETVKPHRAWRMIVDSRAVRQARARQGADMGAMISGFHRFSTAERLLTGRCSGCGAGIRATNTQGTCKACRRRCACGRTKAEKSAVCIVCSRTGRVRRAQEVKQAT